MQPATTHCLAQLTAVSVSAAILITEPQLTQIVVVFVSFTMAFCMGSAMAVGYYYSSRGIETLTRQHASLLGTQFGGILCYLIMICEAFDHIH